jgi:type 1 glutamine amidotransferase/sugar phosphate isomerase/epimerase
MLRSAAASVLGWKVGAPAGAFERLTFNEAAAKIDALGLGLIEGSSSQKLSGEIPKYLDHNLAPGEIEAVRDKLRLLNMRMPAYRAVALGPDETAVRKVFEFARSLGVETIIGSPPAAMLPAIDRFAQEFRINFALLNRSRRETSDYAEPATLLKTVEGRSERIGAAGDLANWIRDGVKPLDALAALKSRLITVHFRGHNTISEQFVRELYRGGLKPSFVSVEAVPGSRDPYAELSRSFESLDQALHPVMTEKINDISRSAAIRTPDRLPPDERQKIEAALPAKARVQPKKPRKLLVLDLNVSYGGHRSIPHANLAIELMAKRTGAYEPVFSNDLANLRYDKIKQFDAIYLNNTVGMIFVDPAVRDGLVRFVREGGGLMGNHGVSHASMDWPEFGEMIGTKWGVHREPTETATVRIDDPDHPLTAVFGGKSFVHQDEYFRFPTGPYSRDKLRVLLTMDVEKTDMNQGRPCPKPCVRADNDYAVSWIRSYGKGRVFFCILGHNPTIYMTPHLAEYFLAGIQFILGDLDADTTPSAARGGSR